jgi:predicted outer membrane repeat protein
VYVNKEGIFIMEDGTISGNSSSRSGVYNSGTFTMQGNASVSSNKGTGVYVNGGTFTMKDSTSISGNTAKDDGGGVYINSYQTHGWTTIDYLGTFTMQDNASVSGNKTTSGSGGGVFVNGSRTSFTMQGNASISGNTAADSGGGIYINYSGNNGTFTMEGGTISGNTAAFKGGGVYSRGTFTMESGTISGNTAAFKGGGVYQERGTFAKTDGTIYGDDAEAKLKNTSLMGHAIYEAKNGGWRNASAGPTDNHDSYGFWLNEGDVVVMFPENFAGTWKRSNFNNTLTLTANTVKASSSPNVWVLQSVSGNAYTFKRSNAANTMTLTIYGGGSLSISGDSGSGQDNWNGDWRKQ